MMGAKRYPDKFTWERELAASGLPAHVRRTGRGVSAYASLNGKDARPGAPRLAEDLGVSTRTVYHDLSVLEATGWLEPVRRGGRTKGGRSTATEYRLTIGLRAVPGQDPHAARLLLLMETGSEGIYVLVPVSGQVNRGEHREALTDLMDHLLGPV